MAYENNSVTMCVFALYMEQVAKKILLMLQAGLVHMMPCEQRKNCFEVFHITMVASESSVVVTVCTKQCKRLCINSQREVPYKMVRCVFNLNIDNKIKSSACLYLLHELADFLDGRLFEFQQLGLFQKFLFHIYELTLELLQPLPALLTQPGGRDEDLFDYFLRKKKQKNFAKCIYTGITKMFVLSVVGVFLCCLKS